MSTQDLDDRPAATLVLAGHRATPARVVARYSPLARLSRTLMYAMVWAVGSVAAFFVTVFDPFITSVPFFVGAVMTYRSWRGRFRVMTFQGACPRCEQALALQPGSKIASPHRLVCYNCHHEPALHLAG